MLRKLLTCTCLLSVSVSAAAGTVIKSRTKWNGITRYYAVYVPQNLPANAPMVLFLHGTQNTSANQPPFVSLPSYWEPLADKNKFLLVWPVSTFNTRSNQWYWDCDFFDFSFPVAPDDVGYLRNLIASLSAQYQINPKRVFVTGMSSGGYMTQRVGFELSDLVAAIAPVSGTIWVQPQSQTKTPPPPVQPVSVIEFHGTLDDNVPYCGGSGRTAWKEPGNTVASTEDSTQYWVAANVCHQVSTNQPTCTRGRQPNPDFTGLVASSCSKNVVVEFVPEVGVGHLWVKGTESVIWDFFASHGR